MKRKGIIAATVALAFIAFTCLVVSAPEASAQKKGPTSVEKGRKLFHQYCATCHGETGKGEGPVAAALKIGPPDLTALQKPGEKFPFYHVVTKIDGEKEVTAHGTSKMPVWGQVFKHTTNEMQSQADVYVLAKYIESIQVAK